MEVDLSKDRVIEIASIYNLKVSFDKEPGLFIGDKKVEIEDLFSDLLNDENN